MRTFFLGWLGVVASMLIGCSCGGGDGTDAGGDVPRADAPSLDVPTSMDVPRADVPGATDTPGLADVPGTTDAPAADAPMTDARDAPSGDAAAVRVTISGFEAYGNCMPIVPPDPIVATWVVDVSGAAGTEARFVSGELVFTGGARVPITVDVPTFPLRGGAASQPQRREMLTTATGACAMCRTTVNADLVYEVDGATFNVSVTAPFNCVS